MGIGQREEPLSREQPEPVGGGKIILGIDFQPGYSDYVPFRDAKVPYLFVTSGACSDYHRPTDTVQRIHAKHLAARTQWIRSLVEQLLKSEARPVWRDGVPPRGYWTASVPHGGLKRL